MHPELRERNEALSVPPTFHRRRATEVLVPVRCSLGEEPRLRLPVACEHGPQGRLCLIAQNI